MEENAYQLLGLEQGPAATEAEIKKVERHLAHRGAATGHPRLAPPLPPL